MERIKYVTFQYEAEITQEKEERKGETENLPCSERRGEGMGVHEGKLKSFLTSWSFPPHNVCKGYTPLEELAGWGVSCSHMHHLAVIHSAVIKSNNL